jgi:tRNA (cytidine32/uridine32-2'-O)-methyltransferase
MRLEDLEIILIEPSHPGNIGAAARAMKVMGLSNLTLVNPVRFPAKEANARAVGAIDLLEKARVCKSLELATEGLAYVYGTTARARQMGAPVVSPRVAAREIVEGRGRIAVVFGREQAGLKNSELDFCQKSIRIPTQEHFKSLNLGQAVQIVSYELRMAYLELDETSGESLDEERDQLVSADQVLGMKKHLLSVMEQVEYFDPSQPKLLERRLARFINGAGVRRSELQIARGFLTAIENKLPKEK